jgi:hypothetical protein
MGVARRERRVGLGKESSVLEKEGKIKTGQSTRRTASEEEEGGA